MKLETIKTLKETNRLGLVNRVLNGNIIIYELVNMYTCAERFEDINVMALVVRPSDPDYNETVAYLRLGN